MRAITTPHMLVITITNIPTITGIMGVMATVIIRPLGLAMVTAEAIMAVILLMGDIMEVVIEVVTAEAIMVAVLAAFMAEVGGMAAGLEAAFTVAIDKKINFYAFE